MHRQLRYQAISRLAVAVLFTLATLVTAITVFIPKSHAAGYSMQTGYYVGDGTSSRSITGLGFQPDFIMLKASSATEGGFKTSAMASNVASAFSATALSTSSDIVLDSNGFTVNATPNALNTYYTWTAFGGSDCSASGNFCVGTYAGDGGANRAITTGFQPSLVINKRSTAVAAHFRTASQAVDTSSYFVVTADATNGSLLRDFSSTGFTVGTADNTVGSDYYYISFKSTAGVMTEGTYTGDGTDNRSITGLGFKPSAVWLKNITSATSNNRRSMMSNSAQPTDVTSYPAHTVADASNAIQKFESDGFQIGSSVNVNETSQSFVWFAFGGAPATAGSGTYKMAVGSYTGDITARSFTGLGFSPDLVIIKGASTTYKVFRTKMMKGNTTAYISVATGAFSGGITSLDADGFSLGTSTIVNGNGVVFQWQAFGNAFNPETKSGAADFSIGSYVSNNVDGTVVSNLPFQPDFMLTRGGSNIGAYKMLDQAGALSGFFSGAGEVSNAITAFTSDGFQLGTNSSSNVSGAVRYDWFAFKNSANFIAGSYAGNGTAGHDVVLGAGIQPDLVWIKRASGSDGVSKPSTVAAGESQAFINTANATGIITGFTSTGMTLSTNFQVNSSGEAYRYMAWRIPPNTGALTGDIVDVGGISVTSPSVTMSTISFPIECAASTGTFGTAAQRLRISNTTSNAPWSVSVAATVGSGAVWSNAGDTRHYDMNDDTGSASLCADGADLDTVGGFLSIHPATATVAPSAGCATTGVNLGSNTTFAQGTIDSITLVSADSSAQVDCYWDVTGIGLQQTVPIGQEADTYTLNLTVTTTSM